MTSRRTKALFILAICTAFLTACGQKEQSFSFDLDKSLPFQIIQQDGSLEIKTLADYQGNWLLVNFWSVSCPPCFEEIPDLAKAHSQLDNPSVTVIGVAMSYDRPDSVLETTQRINIPYPVSFDLEGNIESAFGKISVIPTSFLVDPNGLPVEKYTGKVTFNQIKQDLMHFSKTYQQKD